MANPDRSIAGAGQSNIKPFASGDAQTAFSAGAQKWYNNAWVTSPTEPWDDANGANLNTSLVPAMTNRIMADTGETIGVGGFAQGGTILVNRDVEPAWDEYNSSNPFDTGTLIGQLLTNIRNMDPIPWALVWFQGENDVTGGSGFQPYYDAFITFHGRVKANINPDMIAFIQLLGRRPGYVDSAYNDIIRAQLALHNGVDRFVLLPAYPYDLSGDNSHFRMPEQNTIGDNIGKFIAAKINGSYSRGIRIFDINRTAYDKLELTVDKDLAANAVPYTGFKLTRDGGDEPTVTFSRKSDRLIEADANGTYVNGVVEYASVVNPDRTNLPISTGSEYLEQAPLINVPGENKIGSWDYTDCVFAAIWSALSGVKNQVSGTLPVWSPEDSINATMNGFDTLGINGYLQEQNCVKFDRSKATYFQTNTKFQFSNTMNFTAEIWAQVVYDNFSKNFWSNGEDANNWVAHSMLTGASIKYNNSNATVGGITKTVTSKYVTAPRYPLPQAELVHIVLRYTNGVPELFQNGVEVSAYQTQDTYNLGNKTMANDIVIGTLDRGGKSNHFNDKFYSMILYNNAISDARILSNYNNGKNDLGAMGLIGTDNGDGSMTLNVAPTSPVNISDKFSRASIAIGIGIM